MKPTLSEKGSMIVGRLMVAVIAASATDAYNGQDHSLVPHTCYVAKSGSDGNPGTLDRPFLTIQKAAGAMKSGDTCLIREGVYRETVRPCRSGTPEHPIKFQAYPGETVTVSGADVYDGRWEMHKGSIYKSRTQLEFIQLFVDGVMMNEARWPNMGVNDFFDLKSRAAMEEGDTLHIYDTNLPPGDWKGAIVNVLPAWEWIIFTRRVAEYLPGKSLTFDQPSPHAGKPAAKKGTIADPETCYRPRQSNPYYIFGALAGLDIPTEWFLDTKTGTLYLWTPDNASPVKHLVEIKQRGYAFDLGDNNYIHIEGIHLFAAAIKMEGTHCVVDDCAARYVNHFREQPVIHHWPLGTPNLMAGSSNQWRNSVIVFSADDGIKVRGDHHKVTNCLIHEVGYTGVYAACINAGKDKQGGALHCEFSHNTLFNSGRFILFYNCMSHTLVSFNHMFKAGRLTCDAGITYGSWSETSQNVFSYNYACPVDAYFRLPKGSPGIDAGGVLPPVTDGYVGKNPDIGAYEYGGDYWLPGSTMDPRSLFSYLPGSPSPVESTFPQNGQSGVSTSLSAIELTFVPRMKADSFSGVRVGDGLRFDQPKGDGTRTIILPIIGSLKGNTTYTVTIPATIKPVEGVKILDREYVFKFTTQ